MTFPAGLDYLCRQIITMRHSRKLLLLLVLWYSATAARAQEEKFSPIRHTKQLEVKLEAYASGLRSLSADFTQVREMKMLENKLTSEGRIVYLAPEKIRIEYTRPLSYLMVVNAGRLYMGDEGKVQKVNSGNSGSIHAVNQLLLDCMRGKPFDNGDFSVEAFQSQRRYKLVLKPVEPSLQALFSRVEILLDKASLHVVRLVLAERNGDVTRMSFRSTKKNVAVSDALFRFD